MSNDPRRMLFYHYSAHHAYTRMTSHFFFPVTFLSSYLSQKSELQFPDNTQLYYHSLKVYNTEWLLSDCHQGDYNNI